MSKVRRASIVLRRSGSPRLGACGYHYCSGGCRPAGSASACFQTLLVYARKRDCLTAYYEAMLERCAGADTIGARLLSVPEAFDMMPAQSCLFSLHVCGRAS